MTTTNRIFAGTLLLLAGACGGGATKGPGSENVINIYNWADYIATDTIDRFEAETGIEVNYDTYAAAANVDVKLLTGNSGYDVVLHSNQMSSRLTGIGVFQKLNTALLPNMKNLDPDTMHKIDVYEAVQGYTLPYAWGSTGFAWNVDLVRERLPEQSMDTAAVLFEPELISKLADCGVSFLDGTTSLIPMALAYMGLDPNAVDEESLAAVQEMLARVRPHVRYFSNDKFISDMPNQELCVAMSWSGDYASAARRASEAGIDIDLRYTVPVEGASLWVDGFYIPSDAPHVENAHKFINFMLRADIAFANADFTEYATANSAAWELLSDEKLNNPAIYPDEIIWQRMFAVEVTDPIEERRRTRTLARVKSGL